MVPEAGFDSYAVGFELLGLHKRPCTVFPSAELCSLWWLCPQASDFFQRQSGKCRTLPRVPASPKESASVLGQTMEGWSGKRDAKNIYFF